VKERLLLAGEGRRRCWNRLESLVCSWKRGEDRPQRRKIGTVAKQEEK
jgi:hypothetical protein